MIDPISAKLLAFLPAPTAAGNTNNYFGLLAFHKDTDFVDAKVDAKLTDKDRLSARFSFQRPSIFQAPLFGIAGGPAQGNFEGIGPSEHLQHRHKLQSLFLEYVGGRVPRWCGVVSQRGA